MLSLTNNDLIQAAKELGTDVPTIRAVDEVESNGKGFDSAGQIVIRFESAKFKGYTGITITGSGNAAFNQAVLKNARAAMLSTSWGRYQIMGFNYEDCGYSSVEAFVAAMKTGELAQLNAFIAFVKANQIDDELRTHNWAGFAYRYNGAGYKANNYDGKLAAAYAKYRTQAFPVTNDPVTKQPWMDGSTVLALLALCLLGAAAYYAFDGKWSAMWAYTKTKFKQALT
ncbi:DUF3380 domain-containing protein [Spirosoma sp. HMF4905]|uniref:DUF3380 domain-containing protein n=1 Tax=Spirosoma arboris TaxID=2682092 RepID=A0A7K1SMF4_9BACT|nr:N-acetylmuramidase family protein [Spirosoma arboris]MVM34982.1 DUF3380 domain-containing protein [Spirosoma arboris]